MNGTERKTEADEVKRRIAFLLTMAWLLAGCLSGALADQIITVTFTGDVTLGSEETKKNMAGSFNSYVEQKGYDYFFQNYAAMFSRDDLTIVNLEGVLSDSNRQENTGKTYRFRGPTDYAGILKAAGIDACAISNNHTMDFGKQGYTATVKALEDHGVHYFGNDYYYIFEKNGVKIAFFALVSPKVQGSRDWGERVSKRLREEEGVDAVVMCLHVGTEYDAHRNKTQVNYAAFARKFFTADLVIMHHPHVLQGIDILDESCYVCYSLGNFCFGGNMKIRALETMVVQADLVFTDEGKYKGQQLRLYPAHISTAAQAVGDDNDFLPTPVTGDEALAVMQLVQNDTAFDLPPYDEETGCVALRYLPAAAAE